MTSNFIQVPIWSGEVAGEDPHSGLQVATSLLCPHTAFYWYFLEGAISPSSSPSKATSPIRLGPILMPSLNCDYLLKALSPLLPN